MSCVGARAGFGGGGFFAAGGAAAAVAGRGGGAVAAGAAVRGGGAADPGPPGSGVMMLTGGVDEADGKSIIVVGLPVGTPAAGGIAAIAPEVVPVIADMVGGAPQDAE